MFNGRGTPVSVKDPLHVCPYGIAYRRVRWIRIYGVCTKSFRSPMRGCLLQRDMFIDTITPAVYAPPPRMNVFSILLTSVLEVRVSPSNLLTSVHWGKPLHVFGLTPEVSVVGAHMSLTMGYHYGPSADLLVPVCERHEPPGHSSHPFGGLM